MSAFRRLNRHHAHERKEVAALGLNPSWVATIQRKEKTAYWLTRLAASLNQEAHK